MFWVPWRLFFYGVFLNFAKQLLFHISNRLLQLLVIRILISFVALDLFFTYQVAFDLVYAVGINWKIQVFAHNRNNNKVEISKSHSLTDLGEISVQSHRSRSWNLVREEPLIALSFDFFYAKWLQEGNRTSSVGHYFLHTCTSKSLSA